MTLPLRANLSSTSLSTSRLRASWYHDDNIDDDDDDDTNTNEMYSSSASTSSSILSVGRGVRRKQQQPDVFCWGGWLLNLVAIQQQKKPTKHTPFTPVTNASKSVATVINPTTTTSKKRRSSFNVIIDTTTISSPTLSSSDDYDSDDSSNTATSSPLPPPSIVSMLQHNTDDTIESLQGKADRCVCEGRLLDALHMYQRLLELCRATGQSPLLIGKVQYQTGMIQYKRKCYDEALSHFDQALFIYQLNYDLPEYYDQNNNNTSGGSSIDEDHDNMAIDMYQVYFATGHVHLSNHNPYRAIDYFKRAMQYVVKPTTTTITVTDIKTTSTTTVVPNTVNHTCPTTNVQYYEQVLFALGAAYEAVGDQVTAMNCYNTAKLVAQ